MSPLSDTLSITNLALASKSRVAMFTSQKIPIGICDFFIAIIPPTLTNIFYVTPFGYSFNHKLGFSIKIEGSHVYIPENSDRHLRLFHRHNTADIDEYLLCHPFRILFQSQTWL